MAVKIFCAHSSPLPLIAFSLRYSPRSFLSLTSSAPTALILCNMHMAWAVETALQLSHWDPPLTKPLSSFSTDQKTTFSHIRGSCCPMFSVLCAAIHYCAFHCRSGTGRPKFKSQLPHKAYLVSLNQSAKPMLQDCFQGTI